MAGPETDSAKPKPEAAKTSATGSGDATKYVGTPAVGTSKAAAAGGLATVGPEPSEINRKRGGWSGSLSRHFLAHGSSPSFVFFFPVRFSNLPRFSKSATPQTTPSAWIPSGSRNIVSGWTAHPIACLSSTRAARTSAALLTGRRVKTNSSVPATVADTTVRRSILKGRRRAPWIARTWN